VGARGYFSHFRSFESKYFLALLTKKITVKNKKLKENKMYFFSTPKNRSSGTNFAF
jgi:hypothetical protein